MDVKLLFSQSDTTVRIWMDNSQNHFEFNSDKQLISVIADPDNWLLKKTTVIQLPQVTDFKMHPNPFSGQVQIDFYTGSKTRSFRLSDLNGRLLNEFTSTDMNITIDSVGLSQGIYLLNIIPLILMKE